MVAELLAAGCAVLALLVLQSSGAARLEHQRPRRRPLLRRRTLPRLGPRSTSAPAEVDPALLLDLLAAALAAGAAPTAALAVVGDAVGGARGADLRRVADLLVLGAEPDRAWADAGSDQADVRRCLQLAGATGAPVAGLLRQAADERRRAAHSDAVAAAARLGVRVVLPLGLCALPGFAALGVAPVVLGLAGTLLRG